MQGVSVLKRARGLFSVSRAFSGLFCTSCRFASRSAVGGGRAGLRFGGSPLSGQGRQIGYFLECSFSASGDVYDV